ncbi:DUF4129 domain-containing protein [Formosa algae]|uniref:Protein-glutamine gamma-glutamyltransferase-like C-terminal domain-containing protein n=1 Tax=Formosa algae TaxID=225843 RepID=A0A9X0YMV2_9FLAO|nr:DUF4129 domain-containing protein [Formosa algae]MBP1841672.1 hypothetical protein [Formosa algae]MDQ0337127.1 hypothetical protein [Formosa algae]OEI80546.1 hypothetical protein AST99_08760 [Formosa algae]
MIKKALYLIIFIIAQYSFAQEITTYSQTETDTIEVNPSTVAAQDLSYNSNLKDKYNEEDFQYFDTIKAKKETVKEPSDFDYGFLESFSTFMTSAFPFILGLIIVFIIIKSVLGLQGRFWSVSSAPKTVADPLIYEEEDLHDTDFNTRLKHAIANQDYRLATRYYYLSVLKVLSDKKTITYHKDKTNTEYQFEIENKPLREQFKNISYIYNYVWYGEFPIDASQFQTIENSYKSIFKSIS